MCSSGSWTRSSHPSRNCFVNATTSGTTLEVLRSVRIRALDIRMQELREVFARPFALEEAVEGVTQLAHNLDVLLRHRLLLKAGGFTSLGLIREPVVAPTTAQSPPRGEHCDTE
jgi:hypothetical protein